MLHGDGALLLLDGLLDGDDVHAESAASGRDHGGDLRRARERDALEVGAHLGVLLEGGLVHGVELAHARQLDGQDEALLMVGVRAVEVLPVVLDVADLRHVVDERLDALARPAGLLDDLVHGEGVAHAHAVGDVGGLLGEDREEAPILGVCRGDLGDAHLLGDAVDHELGELHGLGALRRVDLLRGHVRVHGLGGAVGLGGTELVVPLPELRMVGLLLAAGRLGTVEDLDDLRALVAGRVDDALRRLDDGLGPVLGRLSACLQALLLAQLDDVSGGLCHAASSPIMLPARVPTRTSLITSW